MNKYTFIFDLDSTITAEEILPKIALEINELDNMRRLTEATMLGEIPFVESFTQRVKLLSNIPVSNVQEIVENVSLNNKLVEFLQKFKDQCYIVTGNLDVWIEKLMNKIGMKDHYYCSKALVENDKLISIEHIIDKKSTIEQFCPELVVVGDGNNDAEMMSIAKIGIGCGIVREVAPSVRECCKMIIYNEETLYNILEKLAKE